MKHGEPAYPEDLQILNALNGSRNVLDIRLPVGRETEECSLRSRRRISYGTLQPAEVAEADGGSAGCANTAMTSSLINE
uniref:Uncharacterized protein n=1 Tax=Macrostomum lignano TaxID=282301 RepID=A0A1I8HJ08_9PLAT